MAFRRRRIAEETLNVIEKGFYLLDNVSHNIAPTVEHSIQQTVFYPPDSPVLSTWSSTSPTPSSEPHRSTETSILEISTLDGVRQMTAITQASPTQGDKIGVLNFASAKNPGGGFLRGTQAQEESIARSSTLYPALMTDTAQQFYKLHKRDLKGGYYSHAMIYSPRIVAFRDDEGGWKEPVEMDVLTSAAVNAGVVRRTLHGRVGGQTEEDRIEKVMRERIARILFLFENQGAKNLVLGSFGTGIFRNKVSMVATVWADLLGVKEARFQNTFDRVVFAILGRKTFDEFKDAFERRVAGGGAEEEEVNS